MTARSPADRGIAPSGPRTAMVERPCCTRHPTSRPRRPGLRRCRHRWGSSTAPVSSASARALSGSRPRGRSRTIPTPGWRSRPSGHVAVVDGVHQVEASRMGARALQNAMKNSPTLPSWNAYGVQRRANPPHLGRLGPNRCSSSCNSHAKGAVGHLRVEPLGVGHGSDEHLLVVLDRHGVPRARRGPTPGR